ncbi:MAG: hypothetical protein RQ936_02175 [Gammaproteobacteria bacterium]|nr:hypothetical protein [Gammaproteobacteria bacterium]
MPHSAVTLLAIIELGGYPDFAGLYKQQGYKVVTTDSVRKAVKLIRRHQPAVIVSEFNFQSDFRDRTSSLETVLSCAQGVADAKMIVFYEQETRQQYARFLERFEVYASLPFPIDEQELQRVLVQALVE